MEHYDDNLNEIKEKFNLQGEIKNITVLKNGHINASYDVTIDSDGKESRYVFQKVNRYVFKEPEKMMENIDKITSHIAKKLQQQGRSRDCVMHFLRREDGTNYYDDGKDFFRISEFVPDSVAYNYCDDLDKLRSVGKAFGDFQNMLSDFNASELFETIPHFHDTRSRIETFLKHVGEDPCKRVKNVVSDVDLFRKYAKEAVRFNELIDANKIPLRVTHNDTKANNVLFDKNTQEAKTVIDLDTVMPGLAAFDFGDMIRFAGNAAAEDEKDLSKVRVDMDRFRAIAEGFVSEVRNSLTKIEFDTLAYGAFVISYEIGLRFMDDYIVGDKYFKIDYENHNLVRARCQIKLAEDIFNHLDEMNDIISGLAKR